MSEKIIILGKKSINKMVFIWSGVLAFILNILGCGSGSELISPSYYSPLFLGDFNAKGTAIDEVTLLPVKGIEVSVHLTNEEEYIHDLSPISSDITDENGEYELNVDNIDIGEFIVYFHDSDTDIDGNYADKIIKIEMPIGQDNYSVDLETELSEIDE
jgi:putative lipoprotein (rSAM/lipoprotein system)